MDRGEVGSAEKHGVLLAEAPGQDSGVAVLTDINDDSVKGKRNE